jgi:hypothetical protein
MNSSYAPTLPQCTHFDTPGDDRTRCPLTATYLVLVPPMVVQKTPTPVILEGERVTKDYRRRAQMATHCKAHAYFFCGLTVGGGESIPPPTAAQQGYAYDSNPV